MCSREREKGGERERGRERDREREKEREGKREGERGEKERGKRCALPNVSVLFLVAAKTLEGVCDSFYADHRKVFFKS